MGAFGRLMHWRNNAGGTGIYIVTEATEEMRILDTQYIGGDGEWETNSSAYSLGTDFHFGFTLSGDAASAQIYIDGVAVTTNVVTVPVGSHAQGTASMIVCNRPDNVRGLDGRVAHFRVYDVVKNASEMAGIAANDCP